MDVDASKLELLKIVLRHLDDGKYVQVAVGLFIISAPWIVAWFGEWRSKRKIEKLYERYIAGKDEEIKRQALRIKELENIVLKGKRP